ncbi:MAG: hypothetical protein ACI8X3_000637, partial [Saprospiraceae bacterium]
MIVYVAGKFICQAGKTLIAYSLSTGQINLPVTKR